MLVWNNPDTGLGIGRKIKISDWDKDKIVKALESGLIVAIDSSGYLVFTHASLQRAIRCAYNGETLVFPDGLVLACLSSHP